MVDGTVKELPGTGSVAVRGQVVVCSDAQGYVVAVFERSQVAAWGKSIPDPLTREVSSDFA